MFRECQDYSWIGFLGGIAITFGFFVMLDLILGVKDED